jgi:hypothetical protein
MIDVVMGDEDRPDCSQLESRQGNLALDSGTGIDQIRDSVDDEEISGLSPRRIGTRAAIGSKEDDPGHRGAR